MDIKALKHLADLAVVAGLERPIISQQVVEAESVYYPESDGRLAIYLDGGIIKSKTVRLVLRDGKYWVKDNKTTFHNVNGTVVSMWLCPEELREFFCDDDGVQIDFTGPVVVSGDLTIDWHGKPALTLS